MEDEDPRVRFPVSCPVCRQEVMAEYRRSDIVGALLNGRPIRLYAPCHEKSWTPSYVEVQLIRAHVGATRLEPSHRTAPKNDSADD
jgi:hypothetical protein